MNVPPGADPPAQLPEPLQSLSLVQPRLQYEALGSEDDGSATIQMSHVVAEQGWPIGTRHVFVNRLQFRDLQLKSSLQGWPTSESGTQPWPAAHQLSYPQAHCEQSELLSHAGSQSLRCGEHSPAAHVALPLHDCEQ
jgi:hypothetical protein